MSDDKQQEQCCSPQLVSIGTAQPAPDQPAENLPFVTGSVQTEAGEIPIVSATLELRDRIGSWKARWTIGRMEYRIPPRLYAVGNPSGESPVLVSANYKMSFDRLRSGLRNMDAWILVLDTDGINVWCAAGKGTFGTDEIIRMVETSGLKKIVSHRRLILPQLGAPGVSAHIVRQQSGFKVRYGPIRSEDIKSYLDNGMKATPDMRRMRFGFRDRIVLAPTELVGAFKYALLVAVALLVLSGLGEGFYSLDRVLSYGLTSAIILLGTVFASSVLAPALLPWLPARSFSGKGIWIGVIIILLVGWQFYSSPSNFRSWLDAASWVGIVLAIASFITMNFTGSSTYTSLSGVLKEMRIAVPLQIGAASIGLILWFVARFV